MITDSTGREISVGDVITHVSRRGSNMHFHVGVVRRIGHDSIAFEWPTMEQVVPQDTYGAVDHSSMEQKRQIADHDIVADVPI